MIIGILYIDDRKIEITEKVKDCLEKCKQRISLLPEFVEISSTLEDTLKTIQDIPVVKVISGRNTIFVAYTDISDLVSVVRDWSQSS